VGEYIPQVGADTSKLPNGGVYNTTNLQVFNYGNNNPVKYNDPDGKKIKDAIKFFKGWFSYNLTKGLSAGNHNIQSPVYNPIYEKANDIVETIYNVEEQIHSSYIQGLTFISDASGAATLFCLLIGQPEIAGVTGAAGEVANGLLLLDSLTTGDYTDARKRARTILFSRLANIGTGKGLEKLGNSINISIGKNGLYYMKGRRGALKTVDGIRKQLMKDFTEGYFGQKIAPEVASQLTDAVMTEIYKKQLGEKLDE